MLVDIIRIKCGRNIKSDFITKCREDVFRLRYNIYCKEMGVVNENPQEMLYDEFDFNKNTVIFSANIDGKIVGAVRLIKFSKEYKMPMLNEHPYMEERLGKHLQFFRKLYGGRRFIEASRFMLLKEYRRNNDTDGKLISFVLISDYLNYCNDEELTDIIGISNPKLLSFYEKLGFKPLFSIKDELTGIKSPVIHAEVKTVCESLRRLKIKIEFSEMVNRFRRFIVKWIK